MIFRELMKLETDSLIFSTVIEGGGTGTHALSGQNGLIYAETGFPGGFTPAASEHPCFCTEFAGSRIFSQQLGLSRKAVICGGGHVAQELIRILSRLEFEVTVLEDRDDFGDRAREAGAGRVLVGSYEQNLASLETGPETCFVIMTRGHRYDMECLYHILSRKAFYKGFMCSRVRAGHAAEEMLKRGIDPRAVKELHAPVGLPIGAETPAEIAVSVAAEIISEIRRNGREAIPGKILEALITEEEKVLATIVSRCGSAPREAGTRMAVFKDGSITGTLGGGALEAAAREKAVNMLRQHVKTELMTADLAGSTDPSDGMACGGTVSIFFETV